MSHEIRTPMNAIMGVSELLLDTPLNREQRDYAKTSRDSGKALLTIIDDILDFSKIEAGELELETADFNLRSCLEGALDMISHVAASKDIELAYRIAPGTPEAVVGDVTRLRQIFINLLNNAVKFTDQGEVAVEIRYEGAADKSSGTYHMQVRDTGIGIPADRIDRLFQSFKQVDPSTKRKYGGTGLGLAISKRLVGLMGGDIGVTSEEGVGTTFHFTVTLGLQDSSAQPSIGGNAVKGKHILILCDGGSVNCAELKRYTEAWGMQTELANGLSQATEILSGKNTVDILLLDVDKCSSESPELTKLLAAAEAIPRIGFLRRGSSGQDWPGITAFVQKPFKPSFLYDTLIDVTLDGEDTDARPHAATGSAFDSELGNRRPLRILVADDHPTNRKLALQVLRRLGYEPDLVENGRQVLEALEQKSYDLILMDIHMPEMDGLEATRIVRQQFPDGWPRIVVMTANVVQGDWDDCRKAGAVDIVRKPIEISHLIAALETTYEALQGVVADVSPPVAVVAPLPPSVTPPDHHPGRIDPAAIAKLMDLIGGEPKLFDELLNSFRREAERLFADLKQGAENDAAQLKMAAHTIKSSAADFGATTLAAQCAELERVGSSGVLTGAAELAKKTIAEWQAVEIELSALSREMTQQENIG